MSSKNFTQTRSFWKVTLTALIILIIVGVGLKPGSYVLSQGGTATPGADLGNLSPSIPDPAKPVTIKFASWVGSGPGWQSLAQRFHELHPNITIEFQDIPAEEIRTKLLTQVAANNPPDVAYLDSGTVAEFASRNALVGVDSYMGKSLSVKKEDFVPAFMLGMTFKDVTYGVPIDAETTGLFYRTDLFKEAGI